MIRYMMLCLLLVFRLSAYAAPAQWQPAKTLALVVGILNWQDQSYASFPQENRKDAQLVDLLIRRGVPPEHVVFLKDQAATLANIQTRLAAMLAEAGQEDTFFLYFAGHGSRDKQGNGYFINYDAKAGSAANSAWSHKAIYEAIDRGFKGRQVFLTADCCYSGGLIKEAQRRRETVAYACLTSALSNAPSTGHWTFTESLIDGFEGAGYVDLNSDGRITLKELSEHAFREMAFAEEQYCAFDAQNGFPEAWVLSQAGPKADAKAGEHLEVQWQNKWYKAEVLASKAGQLKIRYIGWGSKWDEWLPETSPRLRPYTSKTYPVGAEVMVEWNEKWWPAKILEAKKGLHYIHYPGWSDTWNEWVGASRIREK